MCDRRGSTLLALVTALAFGMAIFIAYFTGLSHQSKKNAPAPANAELSAEETKLAGIEERIIRLSGSLADAESLRDAKTYLAILGEAEEKLAEADVIWDRRLGERAGTEAGMYSGMGEYFETRFSTAEKIEMLAKKFSLTEDRVRRLKADLEMMFWEEWSDKFASAAPAPEDKT